MVAFPREFVAFLREGNFPRLLKEFSQCICDGHEHSTQDFSGQSVSKIMIVLTCPAWNGSFVIVPATSVPGFPLLFFQKFFVAEKQKGRGLPEKGPLLVREKNWNLSKE